jgi:hypothetical protein
MRCQNGYLKHRHLRILVSDSFDKVTLESGLSEWLGVLKMKEPGKGTRRILQSDPPLALPRAPTPPNNAMRTLETPGLVRTKINERHVWRQRLALANAQEARFSAETH